MKLRVEGTLNELRAVYLSLTRSGFDLSGCKLYANAKPGEERGSMKRKIPPFPPSQITDALIKKHGDREFRLYVSVELPTNLNPSSSQIDAAIEGVESDILK
jgi:hypothetical protein